MQINTIDVKKYHWQIILNPKAYGQQCGKLLANIEHHLSQCEIQYTLYTTQDIADCKEITKRLCLEGSRHFIIIGGDGTLNVMVNSLFLSGIDVSSVFLMVIPLGTGNDWVRTHHYPKDSSEVIAQFLKGNFALHDVGLVETVMDDKTIDKRYFINIAGFCFDAEVIDTALKHSSRFFKSTIYLYSLLIALFTHKNRQVQISSPNFEINDKTFTMAVGLCQYNGNGMRQVPMANPYMEQFSVVIIKKIKIWKIIMSIKKLYSGKHISLSEVSIFQTNSLSIHANPPILGEVEGEMLTPGNYNISLIPKAIHTLVISE